MPIQLGSTWVHEVQVAIAEAAGLQAAQILTANVTHGPNIPDKMWENLVGKPCLDNDVLKDLKVRCVFQMEV